MRQKFLTVFTLLLLILPMGLTFADAGSWDQLAWQRVAGADTAERDKDPLGRNIPEASLDIVGDQENAPARYAQDEAYVYFELRVAGKVDPNSNNYNWMALFFPPGATPDPRGNFNNAALAAGLRINKQGKNHFYEVVVFAVRNGHSHGEALFSSTSPEFYEVDNGEKLVRWKVPKDCLPADQPFILATGKNKNSVPNRDWYGLDCLGQEEPMLYALELLVNPIMAGTATCNTGPGPFEEGAQVSVSAVANEGFKFVNWTLDENEQSTDPDYSFAMPAADITLVANFEEEVLPELHTLTLKVHPEGAGSAAAVTDGPYEAGVEVTVEATANPGYRFVGWTEEDSPSYYPQSAFPGEAGNVLIAGHRGGPAGYFQDLDELEPGDEIILHAPGVSYTYEVERVWIVEPSEVEVIAPLDYPALTLTTCQRVGKDPAAQRLIVRARLASATPTREEPAPPRDG